MARKVTGGPVMPVKVVVAADLEENGGRYKLASKKATPVYGYAQDDPGGPSDKVMGGHKIAVYTVEASQIESGEYGIAGGSAMPVTEFAPATLRGQDDYVATPVYVTGGTLGATAFTSVPVTLLNDHWSDYEVAGDASNSQGSYFPGYIQTYISGTKDFRYADVKVPGLPNNPGYNVEQTCVEADQDSGLDGWQPGDSSSIEYRIHIHDGVTSFRWGWAEIHHLNDYGANQSAITLDGWNGSTWTTLQTHNPVAGEEAAGTEDWYAKSYDISFAAGVYTLLRWKWTFEYLTSGDGEKITNLTAAIIGATGSEDEVPIVENTGNWYGAGSSISQAFDMEAHSNNALVVLIGQYRDGADPGVSAITYNGVALTLVDSAQVLLTTRRYTVSAYILDAPATGSNTLAATFTNTTEYAVYAYSISNAAAAATGVTGSHITLAALKYVNELAVAAKLNSLLVGMAVARNNMDPFAPLYGETERADVTAFSQLAFTVFDFVGGHALGTVGAAASTCAMLAFEVKSAA